MCDILCILNQCTCVQAPPKRSRGASRPEKLPCPCPGVQFQHGRTKIPEECAGKGPVGAGLWKGLHKPPSGSKDTQNSFLGSIFKMRQVKCCMYKLKLILWMEMGPWIYTDH